VPYESLTRPDWESSSPIRWPPRGRRA